MVFTYGRSGLYLKSFLSALWLNIFIAHVENAHEDSDFLRENFYFEHARDWSRNQEQVWLLFISSCNSVKKHWKSLSVDPRVSPGTVGHLAGRGSRNLGGRKGVLTRAAWMFAASAQAGLETLHSLLPQSFNAPAVPKTNGNAWTPAPTNTLDREHLPSTCNTFSKTSQNESR